MASPRLPARIREILVCPHCRSALRQTAGELECTACGNLFSLRDNVPVFLAEPVEIAREHTSNPIGSEFETILRQGRDFILNIGAGGTAQRFENCIEFEHKIFRHTDVVGDAHQLPFREAIFDRVFAFNVFEHLRDPKSAAAEIRRVLKPGGVVAIHTAFLQALHEAPHHFYNATEFGVREWFADFETETCEVSGNFGPGVMLGFLSASIMDAVENAGVSPRDHLSISCTTIGEWAEFWKGQSAPPPGFAALQNLPQDLQKRVAAGFQLVARKPSVTR